VGTPHEFAKGPAADSTAGDCTASRLATAIGIATANVRASDLIVIVTLVGNVCRVDTETLPRTHEEHEGL
jgi:hypothetical protein